MKSTIYATFKDPKLAEKAANSLLDHGLRQEDLTVIQSHKWRHLNAEDFAPPRAPMYLTTPPNQLGMATGFGAIEILPDGLGSVSPLETRASGVDAPAVYLPGVGMIIGGGSLASAIIGSVGSEVGALAGHFRDQGIEGHVAVTYEFVLHHGGAVLGATLPSGEVDEGCAWEILNKLAGQNVTSYSNRPYVS